MPIGYRMAEPTGDRLTPAPGGVDYTIAPESQPRGDDYVRWFSQLMTEEDWASPNWIATFRTKLNQLTETRRDLIDRQTSEGVSYADSIAKLELAIADLQAQADAKLQAEVRALVTAAGGDPDDALAYELWKARYAVDAMNGSRVLKNYVAELEEQYRQRENLPPGAPVLPLDSYYTYTEWVPPTPGPIDPRQAQEVVETEQAIELEPVQQAGATPSVPGVTPADVVEAGITETANGDWSVAQVAATAAIGFVVVDVLRTMLRK